MVFQHSKKKAESVGDLLSQSVKLSFGLSPGQAAFLCLLKRLILLIDVLLILLMQP
jgi:hypothetical protein